MAEARAVFDITDEDLLDFVDLIREGLDPAEAAARIGTTGSVMRKFRSEASQWYDDLHARDFREAMEDPERRERQLERLRAAKWREIDRGNTTLIVKESLARDPDWEPLRHTNFRIEGHIDVEHRLAEKYTKKELEEMERQRLGELKALPPPAA
jgi:hypothetical protein